MDGQPLGATKQTHVGPTDESTRPDQRKANRRRRRGWSRSCARPYGSWCSIPLTPSCCSDLWANRTICRSGCLPAEGSSPGRTPGQLPAGSSSRRPGGTTSWRGSTCGTGSTSGTARGYDYRSIETWLLADPVERFEPVSDHHTPEELEDITGWRWFTVDELVAEQVRAVPLDLAPRLRRLLEEGRLPDLRTSAPEATAATARCSRWRARASKHIRSARCGRPYSDCFAPRSRVMLSIQRCAVGVGNRKVWVVQRESSLPRESEGYVANPPPGRPPGRRRCDPRGRRRLG